MIVPDHGRGVDTPAPPGREHERLTAAHRHELEVESGIPAHIIEASGVRSISSAAELPRPDLALIHPAEKKLVRGDFLREPRDLGPGMHLPIFDVHGNETWQYKPVQPRVRHDGDVVKYESPSGFRNVVAVAPWQRDKVMDPTEELWIGEGIKKQLAGIGAGLTMVALAGVDNWRVRLNDELSVELPEFGHIPFNERLVYLCFDSDAATNKNVRGARKRLRRHLESLGATVLIVELPAGLNGEKQGLDDFIAAGGSIQQLRRDAIRRGVFDGPPAAVEGSDGAETCTSCAALTSRIHEKDAELRLIRSGVVSTGEALVLAQLATIRASAQSRGESLEALYVPELARVAGVGENTVTRAFNQLRRWQADPEIAATMPYRLEDYREGRKSRARLVVAALPENDCKATALAALTRLPREEGRARPGGKRCPHHPDAPIIRTTHYRCTEDDCTWVEQESARLNDTPAQVGPVEIHGATFVAEMVAATPAQVGPPGIDTMPAQDGPVRKLIPASFVARDQIEAAAGKPWPDPGVPDAEPIPRRIHERVWRCACGSTARYPRDPGPGDKYVCSRCAKIGQAGPLAVAGGEE